VPSQPGSTPVSPFLQGIEISYLQPRHGDFHNALELKASTGGFEPEMETSWREETESGALLFSSAGSLAVKGL
jgi:hypothetical protein